MFNSELLKCVDIVISNFKLEFVKSSYWFWLIDFHNSKSANYVSLTENKTFHFKTS